MGGRERVNKKRKGKVEDKWKGKGNDGNGWERKEEEYKRRM